MIVTDLFRSRYEKSFFLNKKNLRFSVVCAFPPLMLDFLCVFLCDQERKDLFSYGRRERYYGPVLESYWALPYRKQSFLSRLFKSDSRLRSILRGLPSTRPYRRGRVSLSKMKSLCLSCKLKYVVALYHSDSSEKNAVFVFDRYEDARVFWKRRQHEKIGHLSEDDLEDSYLSIPFLWIESMDHPISLFAEIRTRHSGYKLGSAWFWNFCCFLRYSVVKPSCGYLTDYGLIHCPFGFVYKDRFSRIVYCDG